MSEPVQKSRRAPQSLLALLFIAFVFAPLLMVLGIALEDRAWDAHLLNQRFESEGLQVEAKLIGYRYVHGRGKGDPSGDRPLLRYVAADGVQRTHLALEYGLVSSYGKEHLPEQEIKITYLKSDPNVARVAAWHSSHLWIDFLLPAVFVMMGALSFFFAIKEMLARINEKAKKPAEA